MDRGWCWIYETVKTLGTQNMGLTLKKLLGAQRLSSQFSAESCTQLAPNSQQLLEVLQTSFTTRYSQVFLPVPKNFEYNLGTRPCLLRSRALSISSANLEGVIQSLSPPNLLLTDRTYYSNVNDLTSQQLLLALGYPVPIDETIGSTVLSGNYLSFKPVKVAHSSPVTAESPLYFTTFIEPAFQQLQQSLSNPLPVASLVRGPQYGNVSSPDVPVANTFTQVRWITFDDFMGSADAPINYYFPSIDRTITNIYYIPNESWTFPAAFKAESFLSIQGSAFWDHFLTISFFGSITKFFNDPSPLARKSTVQQYTITFPYLEEEFPEKFPYSFPYAPTPGPFTDNRIIVRTNNDPALGKGTPNDLQPYETCDALQHNDCLGTRIAWDVPSFLLNETNSITVQSHRKNYTVPGNGNGWFFNQCNSQYIASNGGADETLNHCDCTLGFSFLGKGIQETKVVLSNYNCYTLSAGGQVLVKNGQHRTNPVGSIFTCKLFQWFAKHGKGSAMPITISYNY